MKTFKTMLFISLTVFLFASCDSSTTPAPDNVPGDDTYTEIEDDVFVGGDVEPDSPIPDEVSPPDTEPDPDSTEFDMTPYLWIDKTKWECVEGSSAMIGEIVTARLKDYEPENGVNVEGLIPCEIGYVTANGDESFRQPAFS